MKKKKAKNRRQNVPHASLKKEYNSKIRQEYIDLDYVDKLDNTKKNCKLPTGEMVTELEYMSLFMKEWNSGGVSKQSEAEKNKFHRTAEEVKTSTDRTNERNRDQYGLAKARNLMIKMDHGALNEIIEKERVINTNYVEDALIDYLDESKELNESTDDSDK